MTEDYHPPNKSDLLAVIRKERKQLENLLEGLKESQLTMTGVENSWSIKDILAHIAAWERLAFDRISSAQSGEPLKYPLIIGDRDVDRFNADVYEKNNDQPIKLVRAEFDQSHLDFLKQIEALSENFLSSPLPFDWAGKLNALAVISANTHWHYIEHSESIARWINNQV